MVQHPRPPPGVASAPPEAWQPLLRMAHLARRQVERFLQVEASSGLLLLAAAAVALAWANSPWAASYTALWNTPVGVGLGPWRLERTLNWIVNDVLMVVFFFVVGMEIRLELDRGQLSDRRKAALPLAAALGGMAVPAGLYLLLASDPSVRPGWGIPMATDIAFAVGVLALLGDRVPPALRVLLLALAVIDDLGAILVIAVAYSEGLQAVGLAVAAGGVALIIILRSLGARAWTAYLIPGAVVWAGVYGAGVHPTIAGVVIGLLTPVRAWLGSGGFQASVRGALEALEPLPEEERSGEELSQALRQVDLARREALSPAEGLIERLHPWVAYAIMPVFALANAGVTVEAGPLPAGVSAVPWAVAVGLAVGKPLGVLGACALAQATGLASRPLGVGWAHLLVLGLVAGMGFTMSLFIAPLAFSEGPLLAAARLGVLAGTGTAAVLGLGLGRLLLPSSSAAAPERPPESPPSRGAGAASEGA